MCTWAWNIRFIGRVHLSSRARAAAFLGTSCRSRSISWPTWIWPRKSGATPARCSPTSGPSCATASSTSSASPATPCTPTTTKSKVRHIFRAERDSADLSEAIDCWPRPWITISCLFLVPQDEFAVFHLYHNSHFFQIKLFRPARQICLSKVNGSIWRKTRQILAASRFATRQIRLKNATLSPTKITTKPLAVLVTSPSSRMFTGKQLY